MTRVPDEENPEKVSVSRAKSGTQRRPRRATPGDLTGVRRELWFALRRVAGILDTPDVSPADLCRAGNTLAALSNAYRAVHELDDVRRRLDELERIVGVTPP